MKKETGKNKMNIKAKKLNKFSETKTFKGNKIK